MPHYGPYGRSRPDGHVQGLTPVVFTVLREGKHMKIPIKLGVMPMYMQKLKKQ